MDCNCFLLCFERRKPTSSLEKWIEHTTVFVSNLEWRLEQTNNFTWSSFSHNILQPGREDICDCVTHRNTWNSRKNCIPTNPRASRPGPGLFTIPPWCYPTKLAQRTPGDNLKGWRQFKAGNALVPPGVLCLLNLQIIPSTRTKANFFPPRLGRLGSRCSITQQ